MSRRFFVDRALGIPGFFAVGLGLAWLTWRVLDETPAPRAEKCDAIYDLSRSGRTNAVHTRHLD